ncbi:MAG: DUF975 family protein [Prevotellaceae bacterium]|jgi:uncharacterized membrane protein|nr:DUF975 family protein [Prevotellaceae bacterium]
MKRISELKNEAIYALEGKWLKSALITLIIALIAWAISCGQGYQSTVVRIEIYPYVQIEYNPLWLTFFSIIGWLILIPVYYGFQVAMLQIKRGGKAEVGVLFSGFKDYERIFLTNLLRDVYIFLWSLLFIIPGIIKYLSYSMTNYILKDRPDLSYNAAIEESMRMMKWHKWKLFLLHLSFIGWALLCILTLGIGFFFLYPYEYVTEAAFYENLKEEMATEIVTPADE